MSSRLRLRSRLSRRQKLDQKFERLSRVFEKAEVKALLKTWSEDLQLQRLEWVEEPIEEYPENEF